jgi:hypothetical protein
MKVELTLFQMRKATTELLPSSSDSLMNCAISGIFSRVLLVDVSSRQFSSNTGEVKIIP